MAFDGTLKLKTQVKNERHTRGQWTYLETIPAAKLKVQEGEQGRADDAAIVKATKAFEKEKKAAEKEALRQQREKAAADAKEEAERERQLIIHNQAHNPFPSGPPGAPPGMTGQGSPVYGQVMMPGQMPHQVWMPHPSGQYVMPVAQHQPVAIMVSTHNPNYHQLGAGGWFARAFSTTAGIMVAIMVILLVLPMLFCAGCMVIGAIGAAASSPTPQ